MEDIVAVGIGCPGPLDPHSGFVLNPPNLPLYNFELVKWFREMLPKSAIVELLNDADAAALGEYACAGIQYPPHVIFLTLGTGIGGGIIANGELYRGFGQGGELGHTTISYDGRICKCGRRGCLEAYLAESVLVEYFCEEAGRTVDMRDLAEALRSGKTKNKLYPAASQTVEYAAGKLAVALGNFVNIFHPGKIILGGGVTEAIGRRLIMYMKEFIKIEAFPSLTANDEFDIVTARLGNDAGWCGAIHFARQALTEIEGTR